MGSEEKMKTNEEKCQHQYHFTDGEYVRCFDCREIIEGKKQEVKLVNPTKCGCGVPMGAKDHKDVGPGFTHFSKPEEPQEGPYRLKRIGDSNYAGIEGPGWPDAIVGLDNMLNLAYAQGYLAGQAAEREKLLNQKPQVEK